MSKINDLLKKAETLKASKELSNKPAPPGMSKDQLKSFLHLLDEKKSATTEPVKIVQPAPTLTERIAPRTQPTHTQTPQAATPADVVVEPERLEQPSSTFKTRILIASSLVMIALGVFGIFSWQSHEYQKKLKSELERQRYRHKTLVQHIDSRRVDLKTSLEALRVSSEAKIRALTNEYNAYKAKAVQVVTRLQNEIKTDQLEIKKLTNEGEILKGKIASKDTKIRDLTRELSSWQQRAQAVEEAFLEMSPKTATKSAKPSAK